MHFQHLVLLVDSSMKVHKCSITLTAYPIFLINYLLVAIFYTLKDFSQLKHVDMTFLTKLPTFSFHLFPQIISLMKTKISLLSGLLFYLFFHFLLLLSVTCCKLYFRYFLFCSFSFSDSVNVSIFMSSAYISITDWRLIF